jgi:hypothetical protein
MGHVVADLFHYIKSNRKELLNESKVDMNDLITTNDRLFRYSDSEFSDLSIQQGSLQHAMELVSEAVKQDKKKVSIPPTRRYDVLPKICRCRIAQMTLSRSIVPKFRLARPRH